MPLLEYLCEKLTCTTTISRTSGRERKSQEGRCQRSEKSKPQSKNANSYFSMLKLFRYTHYDENGHRIDERVSNERYTSQFDSDPVDSAFGNLSSSFSSSIFWILDYLYFFPVFLVAPKSLNFWNIKNNPKKHIDSSV